MRDLTAEIGRRVVTVGVAGDEGAVGEIRGAKQHAALFKRAFKRRLRMRA